MQIQQVLFIKFNMHGHISYYKPLVAVLFFLLLGSATKVTAQADPPLPCNDIGTTPSKAILVCGTQPYVRNINSLCNGGQAIVPRFCRYIRPPHRDTTYEVWSPVFFRFKCYVAGILGFVFRPHTSSANLDWQLYDITGQNPEFIYTKPELIITGNWAEIGNHTGAYRVGIPYYYCAPSANAPPPPPVPIPFSMAPELEQGHEYILMVASRTIADVSAFTLTFEESTAVIADPVKPHLASAEAKCNGKEITVRLNKPIACSSLAANGSDFKVLPAGLNIVSAVARDCNNTNSFQELRLTLSGVLTTGNYQLVIGKGTDGNTLLDICDNAIPEGEQAAFSFTAPAPIIADSVAKPSCTPDSIKLYYPKKIKCSSIAPDGSDFIIAGSTPIIITGARGVCDEDGNTKFVSIRFSQQIFQKGNYTITLRTGTDGNTLIDECGEQALPHSTPFMTADTVDAEFSYATSLGCRRDTLTFSHNGAGDVNNWKWQFNKAPFVFGQLLDVMWPAKSSNEAKLWVSNGSCIDSASVNIELDNEVKAQFIMPDVICPEDKLEVANHTEGIVHAWQWKMDVLSASTEKDPPPLTVPAPGREAYYTMRLIAFNHTIGCSDTARQRLTVLDNCTIGVPTAFTPNNDGRNDFFWPHNGLKADDFDFKVYNRWGHLVFQTKNWQTKWDGKLNGVVQPAGVYAWMLQYKKRSDGEPVFRKGTVMLVR